MNVELHIEELVLRGVGKGMEHEIRAAMERELAHLFTEEGVVTKASQFRNSVRLDAESFHMTSSTAGPALEARIAKSVYEGIVK